MTEEQENKSLDTWALEVQQNKQSWPAFYQDFLGVRVSSTPRFFRAVNLYGFWPVFEAIIESSNRDLTGDPLAYVLKVASNKWKEAQEIANEEAQYADAIAKSKAASIKANNNLAKRVERRKKKR